MVRSVKIRISEFRKWENWESPIHGGNDMLVLTGLEQEHIGVANVSLLVQDIIINTRNDVNTLVQHIDMCRSIHRPDQDQRMNQFLSGGQP